MPKLLVISQSHNLWGGIESWMKDLFPVMASEGWEVRFALTRGVFHNNPERFAKANNYIGDYQVIDGRGGTPRSRQHSITNELRRSPCDLIVPNAVGDVLPALRQYRHEGGKTRVCIPVHIQVPSVLGDIANNTDLIDMTGVVSELLYRGAIEAFGTTSMPIRLIKYGVPKPIAKKHPNPSSVLRVGFVGRLESAVHKRALDIIPTLNCLKKLGERISFTIAGDGPSAQTIREDAAALAGFHNIDILGYVTRERLYKEVYPKLDCLLLTSNAEGNPLTLIEAMRHGIVPVSSRFYGHATEGLLKHDQNCLTFPVGDAAVAAEHIQRLSRDPILLKKFSVAATSSASVYDLQSMRRGWIDACWEALDSEPRRLEANRHPQPLSYGRLDELRLPVAMVDVIRRIRNRNIMLNSGWDEWPGALNSDTELEQSLMGRLDAIELAHSTALYGAP